MSSILPATFLFEHPFTPRGNESRYLADPSQGRQHRALLGTFPLGKRPVRREGEQPQR